MLILSVFRVQFHRKEPKVSGKYQDYIPCGFTYKFVCVDNKVSKDVVMYRGKNAVYKIIEAILGKYDYCRKVIKNILIKIVLCL